MKKILKFISITILLFIFPLVVKANSISKINMDIYVDNAGTAHVTEIWSANINQGTEGYKPYYNLGNANISNFKVSENGKSYTYNDYWNTNDGFDEKAYKNGINYISNGLELCWGISEYGYHDYVLTYDIEGFVATLTDADMIYWTLIPYELSSKPNDVSIKIYTDNYLSDSVPVWGYGNYGGTAYVYDGYIEMNSEGTLESNEYMTILVKFDKGTFNTYNELEEDFEYYHDMAEDGSTKYKENKSSKLIGFLITIFNIFIQVIVWGSIIFAISKTAKNAGNRVGTKTLAFGPKGKILPKDIPNYRDIPFNKDIFKTFWIAEGYKLNKNKTDFLGAILLKWLKEQKISIKKVEAGFITKKEETAIDLTKENTFDNTLEQDLYNMMKEASKDGILESKEFEKWCNNNYSKILSWFDKVIDDETNNLINEGKITVTEKNSFKVFKSKEYLVDSSMKEEAIKLKGLKNFLEEFSRMNEKEAIEVNMWEYYLIYAQILGIADKVAKQFKKLYPEIIENMESYGYTYTDIMFIHMISHSGMRSATTSQQRAQSYSSGGGGFSSGGGGGGSFGGGGGGGGFR